MKSDHPSLETPRRCQRRHWCISLKARKKYVFAFIAAKIMVIWFIYFRNSYLPKLYLPFIYSMAPVHEKVTKTFTLYNVSLYHIPLTQHKDMMPFYIDITPDIWCFLNGLNLKESKLHKKCKCLSNWYGSDCGIPETVWSSSDLHKGVTIRRRRIPRRIICSVLFLDEFSLLDIMVRNSFSAVDVFIITEEYTKDPPSLVQAMKQGYLQEFQSKLMPLSVRNVSTKFKNIEEWSSFQFNSLWLKAWERIADLRPDDIFLFLHASSIISEDTLIFLKLYDGFPEPFYFELRPLLYRFSRSISTNSSVMQKLMFFPPVGCSFQYFHFICNNDIIKTLTNSCISHKRAQIEFEKNFGRLQTWVVGSSNIPSGWQCNWCLKVHEINTILKRYKLHFGRHNVLTQPASSNFSVSAIINEGKWLDGTYIEYKLVSKYDKYFVPDCVKKEPDKYSFLINGS